MLQELRVENLLLIERAELRLGARPQRAHRRDRGGQDRARPRARPAARRPRRGGDRSPGRGGGLRRGHLRPARGRCAGLSASWPAPRHEEIVLARRLGADGRTRAYLNGRSATSRDLRDAGGRLLSFYGQHEHRKLTLAGGPAADPRRALRARAPAAPATHARRPTRRRARSSAQLAGARASWPPSASASSTCSSSSSARSTSSAPTQPSTSAAAPRASACATPTRCGPPPPPAPRPRAATPARRRGAAAAARRARPRASTRVAGADPRSTRLAERARALAIESQELAAELRGYCERPRAPRTSTCPGVEPTLEGVEERLQALERRDAQARRQLEAVLASPRRPAPGATQLAGAEVAIEPTPRPSSTQAARARADSSPSCARAAQGGRRRFASAVASSCARWRWRTPASRWCSARRAAGPSGADAVEFLIAPNPGVPAGPLREIASGGELSRVMLAIMSAASAAAPGRRSSSTRSTPASAAAPPTRSARGCASSASGGQVLCITHLPQIASLGARHFSIVKDTAAEPHAHDRRRARRARGRLRARADARRRQRRQRRAPPRARPAPRRLTAPPACAPVAASARALDP